MNLRFANEVVGSVSGVFEHQGTWFGEFQIDSQIGNRLIIEYIDFCKDWTLRCAEDKADAIEFDRFSALMPAGSWCLVDGDKTVEIEQPLFSGGAQGEVSWQQSDSAT
jgi:hypothetical protein